MAYDRIAVNVDSTVEESVWKNLATGVCLRYVRHLEIRSTPNATSGKDKGTGDLVAGMLLAALRRHPLLSIGYV
jgi:pyridoxal/pyridoxine/pyridoxamine kinase